MDVEPPASALSQSLVSQSLLASMENQDVKKAAQYDSVKMRYFLSLGMNRPPPQLSASVPTHSYMSNVTSLGMSPAPVVLDANVRRQRTKTAPSPKSDSGSEDSDHRKRTTSVPIPIGFSASSEMVPGISASVGTYLATPLSFDSEEDDQEEGADRTFFNMSSASVGAKDDSKENDVDFDEDAMFSDSFDERRPDSHSQIKPTDSPIKFVPPHEMMANSKKDFNVGTAHSVAVWEQRRRKYI